MPGDFLFCQGTDDYLLTYQDLTLYDHLIEERVGVFLQEFARQRDGGLNLAIMWLIIKKMEY